MPQTPDQTTHFIITIDAETYALGGRLPEFGPNLYGEYMGEEFGVPKIMELSDKYGAKATFFVDVYMHRHYPKAQVAELCQRIVQQGHDVQLHAHTSWFAGDRVGFLWDYSLQRQVEILREGRALIEEFTGRPPVAFRAGSYSANLDTIRALAENGFTVDSSYFARRATCHLSRQLDNRYANRLFHIDEILEIPVTTYRLVNYRGYQKLSKLDVNACSLSELLDVVPKLRAGGLRYIVLFLHSFSFIRWNKQFSAYVPNHRAIRCFEGLLAHIRSLGDTVRFTTMEEAAALASEYGDEEAPDFIPSVGMPQLVARAAQRVWR